MENTSPKSGEFDPMPGLMLSKMANSLEDNNSFHPHPGFNYFIPQLFSFIDTSDITGTLGSSP